jgi:hypothetical protein
MGSCQFVLQINGKKLHPARGAFGAFLLPLLAWWIVALVIYGISFQKVAMLQAPLTSLQVGDKHSTSGAAPISAEGHTSTESLRTQWAAGWIQMITSTICCAECAK